MYVDNGWEVRRKYEPKRCAKDCNAGRNTRVVVEERSDPVGRSVVCMAGLLIFGEHALALLQSSLLPRDAHVKEVTLPRS